MLILQPYFSLRYHGIVEVDGSIPSGSTIIKDLARNR